MIVVKVSNPITGSFENCFSMPIDLDYPGYFVVSGGSGFTIADSIYMKSFKASDPKVIDPNHHFLDARQKKTEFENIAAEQEKSA